MRERLPQEFTRVRFPTWSPDGKLFAFTQPTGAVLKGKSNVILGSVTVLESFWPESEIIVADAQGQKQHSLGRGTELSWSASGEHLAYLYPSDDLEEYHIQITNITTDQTFSVATLELGKEYSTLAWLSETELLYYQETVMLFDYTTGQKTSVLERVKTDIP